MQHSEVDDCEVRISRVALDAWLGLHWCLEKWQILALLNCAELPFTTESHDDELYVVLPATEDDPESAGIDVRSTQVEGEFGEVTPVEGHPGVCALRIGAFIVLFRPLDPEADAHPCKREVASLRGCFVADIITATGWYAK